MKKINYVLVRENKVFYTNKIEINDSTLFYVTKDVFEDKMSIKSKDDSDLDLKHFDKIVMDMQFIMEMTEQTFYPPKEKEFTGDKIYLDVEFGDNVLVANNTDKVMTLVDKNGKSVTVAPTDKGETVKPKQKVFEKIEQSLSIFEGEKKEERKARNLGR